MESSKSNLQYNRQVVDAPVAIRADIQKVRSRAALSVSINLLLASGKGVAGVEVILVEESDVGKKEVCRHEKSKIGGFNS